MEHTQPAPDRADDAWLSVCDDLLWGFNHALSNRLAAITSITRILEYSDTGLDPLLSALSEEINHLERTLDLLRLVPRNPDGAQEPVRLEDLLPDVVRLHGVRGELREIEVKVSFNGDPQPLYVEPARLSHALLVSMGIAARASRNLANPELLVGVDSLPERVRIRMEVRGLDEGADSVLCLPAERELLDRLIGSLGGELTETSGETAIALQIALPTLLALRQNS